MAAQPPAPRRALRGMEAVFADIHWSMGPDLNVAQLDGPVTEDGLAAVARRLVRMHPGLRARILPGEAGRPVFEFPEPEPGAVSVEVVTEGSDSALPLWHQVVERETTRTFDTERGHMLRVIWVPADQRLVVSTHHSVVDGQSFMRIVHHALDALAGAPDPEVAPAPHPAVLDRIEMAWWKTWLLPLVARWEARKTRAFLDDPPLPVQPLGEDREVRTLAAFRPSTPPLWTALRARCDEEAVSVGAVFAAAVMTVMRDHMGGSGDEVAFDMDVNLRGRVDPPLPDDHVGNTFAFVPVRTAAPRDASLWDLARSIQTAARRGIGAGEPQDALGFLDRQMVPLEPALRRLGLDFARAGGAGSAINISNVGRFPYPVTRGDFHLRELHGLSGATWGGPAAGFWLRFVGDHLSLNAAYAHTWFDRDTGDRLLEDVARVLEQL